VIRPFVVLSYLLCSLGGFAGSSEDVSAVPSFSHSLQRRSQSLPRRLAGKLPPRDQLEVLLNQNLAKLIAVKKIEIALPPS
jgi:hypothetical protein